LHIKTSDFRGSFCTVKIYLIDESTIKKQNIQPVLNATAARWIVLGLKALNQDDKSKKGYVMSVKPETSGPSKLPDVAALVVLSICWVMFYVLSVWLSLETSGAVFVWAPVLLVWLTLFSALIISAFKPYQFLREYAPEGTSWRWKLWAALRLYLVSVIGFPILVWWLAIHVRAAR